MEMLILAKKTSIGRKWKICLPGFTAHGRHFRKNHSGDWGIRRRPPIIIHRKHCTHRTNDKGEFDEGYTGCTWRKPTQDASIYLMHGSQVVFAIQKERLTRQKHHWGKLGDFRMAYISHLPDLNKPIDVLVECYSSDSEIRNLSSYEQELAGTLNLAPGCRRKRISHHLAHVYSVFHPSPFENAAVMIIDGQGSPVSESPYEFPIPHDWPSAVYIAHLEESDGRAIDLAMNSAAVLFVVRGNGRSKLLYKIQLATYHAYNYAGGGCFYVNPPRSQDPPGAKLSLHRPGGGIGGETWGAWTITI